MIVIYKNEVFETPYFDKENNFSDGMILIIGTSHPKQYSIDGGENWNEIEVDHL